MHQVERRQLTLMFCDLVGSTALAQRLDPEDLRALIGAYRDQASAVIRRHNGFIARYMGDGLLAYFGYPEAHEEAAVLAARAGLEVAEAVRRLPAPDGEKLAVRIGIGTGLVVVGDLIGEGASQEAAVVGELPSLAARLQAAAEPGTVLVSECTRRLLSGRFECADAGFFELKGYAARVRAWRVVAATAVEGRFDARALAGLAPLVGRTQELELLLAGWRLAQQGRGQVLLISGEAGIGKSRLAEVLHETLPASSHTRLRFFCSPHDSDTAYHPFIDQLRRSAGLRAADPAEERLAKLKSLLAQGSDCAEEELPLFAELCSIPCGAAVAELPPATRKAKTFDVLIGHLERLASKQPVLMVFEDAQWIDPTSSELLERVIWSVASLPVLVLVTFRPDSVPPAWRRPPHLALMHLEPLVQAEREALLRHVCAGARLPAEVAGQILCRTEGVPLFIEEFTRSALESERLSIPSTLQDSLTARLDRLGPVKELAQAAAVIGRSFSAELLSALAGRERSALAAELARLVDAGLIYRPGQGDENFSFKHALLRDAAYAGLTRPRRQALHQAVGHAIEEKFPLLAEAHPELLAYHFGEAGLAPKASAYALRAGDAAAARYARSEARAHFQSALALAERLPEDDGAIRLRIAATLKLAEVALNRQHFQQDLGNLERIRDLAARLGEGGIECRIEYWVGRTHYVLGRFEAAIGHAEKALQQAERLGGADGLCAEPVSLLGRLHCIRGQPRTAIYHCARNAQQMQRLGKRLEEAAATSVLAFAYGLHGQFDNAYLAADRGIELASAVDHLPTAAASHFYRGVVHGWRGDLAGARLSFATALELAGKARDAFREYVIRGWRGEASLYAGKLAAAAEDLRCCLGLAEDIGTSFHRGAFQAFLARVLLLQGNLGDALAMSGDAVSRASGRDDAWSSSIALRIRAEVLLTAQSLPAAQTAVRAAIAIQERHECHPDHARSLLALAAVLATGGKRAEANAALARARRLFDAMAMRVLHRQEVAPPLASLTPQRRSPSCRSL